MAIEIDGMKPAKKKPGMCCAAVNSAESTLVSSVHPGVKKMSTTTCILLAGLIVACVQVAAFAYFLTSSFISKLETKFLSLDASAGVCEQVTLSTTSSLKVDKYGNWDTSASYQSQEALFTVQFNAYKADSNAWGKDMTKLDLIIQTELDFFRSISDLPKKILHLISWRETLEAAKAGTIEIWFTADPKYIFDNPNAQLDAQMGQAADACVEPGAWSVKNGVLSLTFDDVWEAGRYDANNYTADLSRASPGTPGWDCATFDITENGYDTSYPTTSFDVNVDLRASATVAALNAGVIEGADLLTVSEKLYIYQTDDPAYADDGYVNMEVAFDPKFPDMAAILLDKTTDPDNMVFQQRLGDTLWDVEFSGWYYAWSGPAPGSKWDNPSTYVGPSFCPASCETSGSYCNAPDFVFSFSQVGSDAAFKINLYANELFTINIDNMDPGHIGCATSTVGSGLKLGQLQPTSPTAFASNLDKKPFKLTEEYLACTPEPVTAFIDSVGIAQGNSALFVAITVAMIMAIASYFPGLLKSSSVSNDEVSANNELIAEMVKAMTYGDVGALKPAHKDLQTTFKLFLAADIPLKGGKRASKAAKDGEGTIEMKWKHSESTGM
jgi:hypothetical protein